MTLFPRRAALPVLAAVLLAPAAVRAQAPDDEGWTPFVAPPSSGGVLNPTTPEGGFGSPDRTRLDQQLRRGVLDQVCRQAQIPLDYDYGIDGFGSVGAGVDRYLRTDVDDQIALVDDDKMSVNLSHGWTQAVGAGGEALGFSFGASIEGHSMVIRRTGSKKSCDEVLKLLDFRDVKLVLPMKAERLRNMALGELWRMPFTLTYAEGVSASETQAAGGTLPSSGPGMAAVTVSLGRSDSGAASMTLYRIAPDKLRFRFRIDHVVVWSRSAGVTETYPPLAFAIGAQNILTRLLEREAAHQLDQYLSAWMTFGQASADGKKMLMEFVIDPRDPEQAEALAKVVRGDMRELVKLSAKMSAFQTKSTIGDYLKLRESDASHLGPSTYAASDEYKSKTKTFALNLPFLVSHNSAALFGEDKVDRYGGVEGEYRFYRADKSKNNSYFTLPIMGPLVKENTQRDVEAVTYAPKGGAAGDPIVVYIRNRGYLRVTGSTVRDDVDAVNGVLALAGARRGTAGGPTLPVDAIVPPSPMIHGPALHGQPSGRSEPSDRKGLLSFTLVLNEKAVKDVLAAPAQEVLKAFAASVGADDRPMAEWLAAHATVKDGQVSYSWQEARRQFDRDDDAGRGAGNDRGTRELASMSRRVAGLLSDLASARDANSNEERAQALAVMIGGRGKSGLAYEDSLRVLVQFVDPMDLTGDFVANVKVSTKGVKAKDQHWVLKKGRAEVPLLKEAGEAKARFAEPSILVD